MEPDSSPQPTAATGRHSHLEETHSQRCSCRQHARRSRPTTHRGACRRETKAALTPPRRLVLRLLLVVLKLQELALVQLAQGVGGIATLVLHLHRVRWGGVKGGGGFKSESLCVERGWGGAGGSRNGWVAGRALPAVYTFALAGCNAQTFHTPNTRCRPCPMPSSVRTCTDSRESTKQSRAAHVEDDGHLPPLLGRGDGLVAPPSPHHRCQAVQLHGLTLVHGTGLGRAAAAALQGWGPMPG